MPSWDPRNHEEGDPYSDGMLRYTLDAFASAIHHFTTAIDSALSIRPDFRDANLLALAYYQRAECYEVEGRYRDAIQDVREYIKLKPEDYRVSGATGTRLRRVALTGLNEQGYTLAARIWGKCGKWRKAEEKLARACQRVGDDPKAEKVSF